MLKQSSHWVLAVVHRVPDPRRAAAFFVDSLGFSERGTGVGWVEVENGALGLRLVAATDADPPPALELELVTGDVEASREALLGQPGVTAIGGEVRVEHDRIEQRLAAPFGVVLVLTRKLTEDDLGELPPLPTELLWDPAAEELVQRLLRRVPLAFRADARRRITGRAEHLAVKGGGIEVTRPQATRAFILSTPSFQHDELAAALRAHGIDCQPYAADFAAD